MIVLGLTPVELPARVGPQLEITRIERVGQGEESTAATVLHLHKFTLNEVAIVVPQLSVEYT